MMSIIAILFTASIIICAALNSVSAAYCGFFPAACAAGTEQASSHFYRAIAIGRVPEAKASSNASGYFGTAILGMPPLNFSLTANYYFLTSRPDCLCGTFVPSRDSQGVFCCLNNFN